MGTKIHLTSILSYEQVSAHAITMLVNVSLTVYPCAATTAHTHSPLSYLPSRSTSIMEIVPIGSVKIPPHCRSSRKKNEPVYEKLILRFSGLLFFNCALSVPYLGNGHVVLPEASSRSLLHVYVCKQQWLWRDCAFAQVRLSLCWSPV